MRLDHLLSKEQFWRRPFLPVVVGVVWCSGSVLLLGRMSLVAGRAHWMWIVGWWAPGALFVWSSTAVWFAVGNGARRVWWVSDARCWVLRDQACPRGLLGCRLGVVCRGRWLGGLGGVFGVLWLSALSGCPRFRGWWVVFRSYVENCTVDASIF